MKVRGSTVLFEGVSSNDTKTSISPYALKFLTAIYYQVGDQTFEHLIYLFKPQMTLKHYSWLVKTGLGKMRFMLLDWHYLHGGCATLRESLSVRESRLFSSMLISCRMGFWTENWCGFFSHSKGVERWLGSEEHLLLLQRTWVWFPTFQCLMIPPLLVSTGTRNTNGTQTHPYTLNKNNKSNKKGPDQLQCSVETKGSTST